MYQLFLWQMGIDVCAGQFRVFVYLVLRCLLGCCTWFSCCAAIVGLSIRVWYCHVPGHWFSGVGALKGGECPTRDDTVASCPSAI